MFTFNQSTGYLLRDGKFVAAGYAGRGFGKNNPSLQRVKGIGPLPVGFYTIEEPHDDDVVGKYAMPLIPDATNNMYGRKSFFMHGDAIDNPGGASHGCIVAPRLNREYVWASGDHRLQVISGLPAAISDSAKMTLKET